MTTHIPHQTLAIGLLAIGLLEPILAQVIVGLCFGESIAGVFDSVKRFWFSGANQLLVYAWNVGPFGLLIAGWLGTRSQPNRQRLAQVVGGLIGAFAILMPVHFFIWKEYFSGNDPGLMHALLMIPLPAVYMIPMAGGFFIVWILGRAKQHSKK